MIEQGFPTFFTVVNDYTREMIVGNIMEMKARDALTIGIIPRGDSEVADLLDYTVEVEHSTPEVAPYTYTPPFQLIAYYASVRRGYDPDKPRNLAKTVTVE